MLPRFSIDLKGKYAVSHAPYIISKDDTADDVLLKFFVAVLNSTVIAWQVSNSSDRYSQGYARLEVKTLSSIRVPDPAQIKYSTLSQVLQLVDNKLLGDKNKDIDNKIDQLIADIYGLNLAERTTVGFQG